MRKPILLTALVLLAAALAACSAFTPRRGFNRVLNDRNVQITAQRYPTVIRCVAFGTLHCFK